ncbi:hypothetical protein F183_A28170 [Bryobacterales bacterium F-183]|nr:hypothetical protein F183_A28170 [Bryobacterales bacterium F-183]
MLATLNLYPNRNPKLRLFALWYFCTLLVLWNIAGQTVLGFEQSNLQPIASVSMAIAVGMAIESLDAWSNQRRARWSGGWVPFLNFLPACIIPGLACSMLTYSNERLAPVLFAASLSMASKVLFKAPLANGQMQHIFNPSNFGITMTLLLLPDVGLAPPYQFTENLTGAWHWVLPGIVMVTGVFVHAKFTGRLPLVLSWLAAFAFQGLVRAWIFDLPVIVPFVPMTSVGFILFSLYMIPDPATTPLSLRGQIGFGVSVATIYAFLFVFHVVFGLFIAVALTSAGRGVLLYAAHAASLRRNKTFAPQVAVASPVAIRAAVAGD